MRIKHWHVTQIHFFSVKTCPWSKRQGDEHVLQLHINYYQNWRHLGKALWILLNNSSQVYNALLCECINEILTLAEVSSKTHLLDIKMKFVKHEQKWSQTITLSSCTHLA